MEFYAQSNSGIEVPIGINDAVSVSKVWRERDACIREAKEGPID